jgi:eukaryotic-like serine/threonine-protein kinase
MAEVQSESYPKLGRYQVINKIAAGGMAEVFLAKATGAMGFSRLVALKLIHSNFTRDEEFVKMFIDEARIAMHLHHRNIVQVFDLDQIGDTYFIAMEFVHGVNLYDLYERIASKNRWIDPPMALYLIAEVSKGLHFAHTRTGPDGRRLGIIHRDISPQNVLLSFEGEVKITDFGIATAAERLHQTAAGIVKGKYAYMAPERLQERPIDARVDVFSVGVLMYELLVGENPFAGPSAVETIENVLNKPIPPPSERGAPVTKRLDEICLKALARDPAQRYASGQALADAVTEYAMELTHARKDMAAGDAALTALLAELFPEKVASPPRAGDPNSLNLPGVAVVSDVSPPRNNGTGDFVETQEDMPAEVVSAAFNEASDDFDAPTVLRMSGSDSGLETLPPGAKGWDDNTGDATVPTEMPNFNQKHRAQVISSDDSDAFARTMPSSSGITTLPDDMPEPAVVPLADYSNVPQPMRSEQLVVPVVSSGPESVSLPRKTSKLNVIAGLLLVVAVVVVGAALFVVSGKEEVLVQIDSKPPGAEVWIDGVKQQDATPYTLPLEANKQITLEFKLKGYKPATRRIQPPTGMTVSVQLEEITGALTVTRTPPDAEVIINGIMYEGEDVRLTGLKLQHPLEIVIQADKYIHYEKTVTLDLDTPNRSLEVALAPGKDKDPPKVPELRPVQLIAYGSVLRVSRHGKVLCKDTPCKIDLPVGEVRLELHDEQTKADKTVTVEIKKTTDEIRLQL